MKTFSKWRMRQWMEGVGEKGWVAPAGLALAVALLVWLAVKLPASGQSAVPEDSPLEAWWEPLGTNQVVLKVRGHATAPVQWRVRGFAMDQQNATNPASGGGGATYLVNQNFEGTGYDNSEPWTEGGVGTIDEDYTTAPAPIVGSQSLRLVASANEANTYATFTAQDTVYVFARVNFTSQTGDARILSARDNSGTLAYVYRSTSGYLNVQHGSAVAATSSTTSTNTNYYVWFRYTKGTGSDGVANVGFSTDGTRPTGGGTYASVTTGTSTAQASRVMVGSPISATFEYVVDQVLVDDVQIGDNPTPPVSYLVNQNFEGTGAPSGWLDSGSEVDYDYATALEGSQSLRFNTTTERYATYSLGAAYDTLHAYFMFRPNVLTNWAYVFRVQTDAYSTLAHFRSDGSGGWQVGATADSSSAGSWSAGNTYHVWFQYTKGTGSDAIAKLWVSTNATKPGSPTVQVSTGASTAQAQRFRFGPSYGVNDLVYDKFLVSTNEIGSNP